jgi:hypothetical protein
MAYEMAKKNNGAPGTDGVTFEDIETQGVATFLAQIQEEAQVNAWRKVGAFPLNSCRKLEDALLICAASGSK